MENLTNKFIESVKRSGKDLVKTGENLGYGVLIGSILGATGCKVQQPNWSAYNDYEVRFDNSPQKDEKLDYKTFKAFHNREYISLYLGMEGNVLPVEIAPVRANLEKSVELTSGYQELEIPEIVYIGVKAEDGQGGFYDRIETGIRAREESRPCRINHIEEKDLGFDLPERIVLGGEEYFTFTRGPEKYVVPREGTKAIIEHGTRKVIFENEDNIIKLIPKKLTEAQRRQYASTYFLQSEDLKQENQNGHVYKHQFNQKAPEEHPLKNAVFYTIQKGDTFWGIADKNNLGKGGATQIQSLNPNVDPKKLKVGQKIRIK